MKKSFIPLKKNKRTRTRGLGLVPDFLLSSQPDTNDLSYYVSAYKKRRRLDGESIQLKNS